MEHFVEEMALFNAHREGFAHVMGTNSGAYMLIKGSQICGLFDDIDSCYQAGVARFGLDLFMCKEVRKYDQVISLANGRYQVVSEGPPGTLTMDRPIEVEPAGAESII